MDVAKQVDEMLVRGFGVEPGPYCADTPLHRLRLDSLALEELRVRLEERFDVDLGDVELSSRNTYGQLLTAVRGAVAE